MQKEQNQIKFPKLYLNERGKKSWRHFPMSRRRVFIFFFHNHTEQYRGEVNSCVSKQEMEASGRRLLHVHNRNIALCLLRDFFCSSLDTDWFRGVARIREEQRPCSVLFPFHSDATKEHTQHGEDVSRSMRSSPSLRKLTKEWWPDIILVR